MARPRTKSGYFAWSDLYNGGESEKRPRANGQEMTVVLERNIITHGSSVTQEELGVDDDEWGRLIESGVIRTYAPPEGTSEYVAPSTAMMRSLVNDTGDIDVNKLMELGLAHPPVINPPSEAQAEIPEGA